MPRTPAPFNVNSAGWTAYYPQCQCWQISVREVAAAGTANYLVAYPSSSDGPKTMLAGEEFFFKPGYLIIPDPNKPAFYLKMASGSVNFDANEQ